MPVARFDFFIILYPFLDGIVTFADPDRRELCHRFLEAGYESLVLSQQTGCIDASLEQFHGYLDIHGG